jgi:hypothetical protein
MKLQLDGDVRGMVGERSVEAATEAFVRCQTSLGAAIGSALRYRPRASLRGLSSSTGAVIPRDLAVLLALDNWIELQLKFHRRPWHLLVSEIRCQDFEIEHEFQAWAKPSFICARTDLKDLGRDGKSSPSFCVSNIC